MHIGARREEGDRETVPTGNYAIPTNTFLNMHSTPYSCLCELKTSLSYFSATTYNYYLDG
jgi:hypothetical protein